MKFYSIVCLTLAIAVSSPCRSERIPLSGNEEAAWLNRLIPLPQEIGISAKFAIPRSGVVVETMEGADDVELSAGNLVQRLIEPGDASIGGDARFNILLRKLGEENSPDAETESILRTLKELPNNGQAYRIESNGSDSITVSALTADGLYFGANTLYQLIDPTIDGDRLEIPDLTATDWPDIEERGVWNFPPTKEWVDWMASMKLNYGNLRSDIEPIERDKPNSFKMDVEAFEHARLMAFRYIPQIVHLNFLDSYGLFRAYPGLAGLGDEALAGRYFAHKQGPQHRVPDASNPKLAGIIAEWMIDIAEQGPRDICCWLTERPATDTRPVALQEGQFVLEARAFVNAWEKTRERFPDLAIRMFLSTTTDERYYKIYDELPQELKIVRCCATDIERFRRLPRDLFRNTLLDDYAAKGRWVGTYDVPLNVNGNVETPEFKIPHRSPHRIKDYVEQLVQRKYQGAIGMMAWGNHAMKTCGMNTGALAEWGWNLYGRTEREFAVAWAQKVGHEDPEKFADWADLMGPVEFDVFDSEFPICYSWGQFIELVRDRRYPVLGEGVFRYYRTPESFDEKIATCDRAMQIAGKFEDSDYANETKIVRSYIQIAKWIYSIAEKLATDDLTTLESQKTIAKYVEELNEAGKKNVEAIETWRSALGGEDWHYRVHDAIEGTEETVDEIADFVTDRYLY
jgi:hypothetical protein